jgi:molybdopterin/thiamine biosynthesis adenylyltransferase
MNVAVIGCGARGALVAGLLASAGIEQLSLVDGAFVTADDDAHPLQFSPDAGAGKADALVAKIALINPESLVLPFPADLDGANAEAIIADADVVVDCTGSDAAAEALSAACASTATALIAAPDNYVAASANVAEAAKVAADQAARVLKLA